MEPKIEFDFNPVPITNENGTRYIIKIDIHPSSILPVTLHEDNLLGIYVRHYSSTELVSPLEIRDMVLLSDNNPFDSAFTENRFSMSDFSSLFNMYREKNGSELTEKALVSIGFMSEDGRLSRGAELFRDNYDGERTKLVCTLWPETTKGSLSVYDAQTCTGNIFECLRTALDFVMNHSINGFKKEDVGRKDIFSYPARSVTEGIVNALAHRNYFIQGSQIEVNMFKDRLEITSPGSLLGVPELRKEKNISSIIPKRRNEVICLVLCCVRLMESKGSGFDRIEQDYRGRRDSFQPFISSDESSFTLTLPNLMSRYGVLGDDSVPEVYAYDRDLEKSDRDILGYCYSRGRTAAEIASYLGVEPSTYFRKKVLASLVDDGYLLTDSSQRALRYSANLNRIGTVG